MAGVRGAPPDTAGARPPHRPDGILDLERAPAAAAVPRPGLAHAPSPRRHPGMGGRQPTAVVVSTAAAVGAAVCGAVVEGDDGLWHRPDVLRGIAGQRVTRCFLRCCRARGGGVAAGIGVDVGTGILDREFEVLVVPVVAGTIRSRTQNGQRTVNMLGQGGDDTSTLVLYFGRSAGEPVALCTRAPSAARSVWPTTTRESVKLWCRERARVPEPCFSFWGDVDREVHPPTNGS